MPPLRFYPGHTWIAGPGIPASNSLGDRSNICWAVGLGTRQDPRVCYAYDVNDCQWLTAERRAFLENELRMLARKCGMACVVVRGAPHNRMIKRTRTGQLLMSRDRDSGRMRIDTAPAEWHITILMGEDLEHCQVQGHLFTYMAPNPTREPPPDEIVKIMDDPVNQRRDRRNISMELWVCKNVRVIR